MLSSLAASLDVQNASPDSSQLMGTTKIRRAIAEVLDKPITHIIYSHFHKDHIGGTADIVVGHPIIIA
jgi:glyoxylase-like metal-dependent hydrolase (beta-lactamase superfamily II)